MCVRYLAVETEACFISSEIKATEVEKIIPGDQVKPCKLSVNNKEKCVIYESYLEAHCYTDI